MRRAWIGLAFAIGVSACNQGGGAGPNYMQEYGGSQEACERIEAMTDCASLQAEFDQAEANNEVAEPGTDQDRWTTGYMAAAEDRMRALGCDE